MKDLTDGYFVVLQVGGGRVPKLRPIAWLRRDGDSPQSAGFDWQSNSEVRANFRSDFGFVSRAIVG